MATEIDELGKQFLPEGRALSTDRAKDARTVVDRPDQPVEYRGRQTTWEKDHNLIDLAGFDTRKQRERKAVSVIKELRNIRRKTNSGEDAVIEEPERFLDEKQKAGQLIAKYKKLILDFDSFKAILKRAWSEDPLLPELFKEISDKDDIIKLLFETNKVQDWIKENSEGILLDVIRRQYGVEVGRAGQILKGLSNKQRLKLLRQSDVRVEMPARPRAPRRPTVRQITQRSRAGREYTRAFPRRWISQEITLLRNYRDEPLARIQEIHAQVFPRRTLSSIRNKVYRVRTSQ